MSTIIATEHLSKRYADTWCVKDVDLCVPEGAVYGFLGPNGAGKTTTIKLLLGLARPTEGETSLLGKTMNAGNRLDILKQVGSLVESPSHYPHLTGEENLRIAATLRGLGQTHIDEALHTVRLTEQRNKKVGQYSLGMKQRLGLATALLGLPRLLILDEPTNGLDPAGIQEMRELLRALPERHGMTVFVSSHLLSEMEQLAGHVGIIRAGELVYQDSIEALRNGCERKLALRTLDNVATTRLLAERGEHCDRDKDYILLPDRPDKPLAELCAFLCDRGIGVVRIEQRQRSLEQIFLEMTGVEVSL